MGLIVYHHIVDYSVKQYMAIIPQKQKNFMIA